VVVTVKPLTVKLPTPLLGKAYVLQEEQASVVVLNVTLLQLGTCDAPCISPVLPILFTCVTV
jgi:hypothetical protein